MYKSLLMAKTKGVSLPAACADHGYVDGYMEALLEANIATQRELLAMVAEERANIHGPALVEECRFRRNIRGGGTGSRGTCLCGPGLGASSTGDPRRRRREYDVADAIVAR